MTLGTFTWEPGNLYLGPWEPLLGNLYLGTWEPLLGTLGTFTSEPLLGNLGTFTWNLGTLGEWVLELLRSAPKPLLWLKTPKHSAVGEENETPSEHVKNVGKARALLEALTPQAWVSLNDHLTVENASHAQSKHTPHFSITGHNHGSLKVQDVDRRLLNY